MWDRFDVDDLDNFVKAVDDAGGVQALYGGIAPGSVELSYRTIVDDTLDPFSEEYVSQQIALYEELAGRHLDQEIGEQANVGVDEKIDTPNPYGSNDIGFIAKHSRAILSGIMAANLAPGASILDMGCGWGMSTQLMAFCGAQVTALDINPAFIELNRRRAERLNLPVKTVLSTFDTFETDERFDCGFFYECLHHAVRPWEVIERVGRFLNPGAKIVLAAEPYVEFFRHWGLRIEPLSFYCIRKFGWFESGWTMEFITACFDRVGWDLAFAPIIGLDNGMIGVAHRKDEAADHDFFIAAPYMHLAQSFHDLSARHIELARQHDELRNELNVVLAKRKIKLLD
jgi:2-polyprenyl-3-methyl-5-hydroxy-6-metoxy-1,4-benzoquinol methylase